MDIESWAVAVALCCTLGGCANGDGGSFDLGSDTDSGDVVSSGAAPADGTGLDETGGEGDGTTSDATDDTGPPDHACDIDCGEGGHCELDPSGAPTCVCAAGHAAFGLRCLPCTPTDGAFDVDVPRVTVSASFTLDGEPFPPSAYERGRILLRDVATGDEVVLGDTRNGGGEVAVVPGNYEVHYAWIDGDVVVPANRGARLATVAIPDTGTHELDVDVPVVELSGRFTLGGAEPPRSQYENGSVVLVHRGSGDEVPLGDTRDGEYRVKVIPGTYELRYRAKVAEDIAPINRDARLEAAIVIDGSVDAQTLDVDVEVAMLSGSFTIDGQAPPPSIYENGRILLRDLATGHEVELGQTRDGSYDAPVVAGEYQLVYQRLQGGALVPVNRAALLDEVVLAGGARALDVDVATAVITGTITVGGQVPPSDPGDDGLVFLRNPVTGDEARLGNTADGAYSRRVVPGTYDVYYRQETSGGGVPVNTNAFLQSIDLRGGASLDIDVPMVTVSAAVTVDGQLPPESAYDDGMLYLRNAQTGDSVLLGNTRHASLERPVVPGTYDVVYVVEAAGPTMPVNARSRLATVDIGAGTALDIDIPVAVLEGAITVAGQAPPQSAYERSTLLLLDPSTDDVVHLAATEAGAFARPLTAGTYVVVYQALATTGLLPANARAGLACIDLSTP